LNAEYGPYNSSVMRGWFQCGDLPGDLLVKRLDREDYVPLASLGPHPFAVAALEDDEPPPPSAASKSSKSNSNDTSISDNNDEDTMATAAGTLQADLGAALEHRFVPDFFFVSRESEKHFASRWLLCMRSRGLSMAVRSAINGGHRGIHLGVPSAVVKTFLRFVYTGVSSEGKKLGQVLCIDLLPLALHFGLPNLAKRVWGELCDGLSPDSLVPALRVALVGNMAPHYPKLWTMLLQGINAGNAEEILAVVQRDKRQEEQRTKAPLSSYEGTNHYRNEVVTLCRSYMDFTRETTAVEDGVPQHPLDSYIHSLANARHRSHSMTEMTNLDSLLGHLSRVRGHHHRQHGIVTEGYIKYPTAPKPEVVQIAKCLPIIQGLIQNRSISLDLHSKDDRCLLRPLTMLVHHSDDLRVREIFWDTLDELLCRDMRSEQPLALLLYTFIMETPCPNYVIGGDEDLKHFLLDFVVCHPELKSSNTFKQLDIIKRKQLLAHKMKLVKKQQQQLQRVTPSKT